MIPKTCAIVPAAGRGIRMGGGRPKQFLELFGKPILAHTLGVLSRISFLSSIYLIVPEDFMEPARRIVSEWVECGDRGPGAAAVSVVAGGAERQDSVYNGLLRLPPDCEWVMIHDGVRPFASPGLITATWEGARATGASIAAVPATDTVKRAREGIVSETLVRDEIWLVQTPQVFRKEIILAAYDKAVESGWSGTDDASFVERIGVRVSVVRGERSNVKVTTPDDLDWARWFLSGKAEEEGA
ncbi:MAG: 2-C-methyl-D-erythritol 4-phosphate cytidylyltransferase [Syntrophobacteraceae bacterium]